MIMQTIDALAVLITEKREYLLERWRQQVRQLPSAKHLDVPAMNDHVPGLLDEIARALQLRSDQTIPEVLREGSSPAHGLRRLQDGFDPTGDELPQGRVAFTTFPCPYCQRLNHGRLGGQFARVSGSFSYSAGLDASSMARRIRLVATVS